ncbi:MAG: ATP synthase F1 subunit gamma [Elusimicrobiales bacterium]|nr:ATP synthase F1 subunit gamma [Elusimicrobiales bacterium]MCK5106270.1 ATP synthase F1 subunit gamma [Elusimicrobiales bacterium]
MASLRDIRRHISSVKSIKQITYAMKMVAAARIKKAQNKILNSRPFADKMEEAIKNLYTEMGEEDFRHSPAFKLFEKHEESNVSVLIVITSDKGLCGSFNVNVLKRAVIWLKENKDREIKVIAVGRKGRDFFKRLKGLNLSIAYELVGIFPKASYAHAKLVTDNLFKLYEKEADSVTIIYNRFKSMMSQEIIRNKFLPLKRHFMKTGDEAAKNKFSDFDFEPAKELLLSSLLPRYIKAQIFKILLESQAAELAARMNAMEAASGNASDIIEDLTLKLNKTRQTMITTELNEIVAGAGALEG